MSVNNINSTGIQDNNQIKDSEKKFVKDAPKPNNSVFKEPNKNVNDKKPDNGQTPGNEKDTTNKKDEDPGIPTWIV